MTDSASLSERHSRPGTPCTEPTRGRDVIVGAGSSVWRELIKSSEMSNSRFIALRHEEVERHQWMPGDRAWIFAYARRPSDNLLLFEHLGRAAAGVEFIYLSSSSCIVTSRTRCYKYPVLKAEAALNARKLLGARILVLGLVHKTPADLPAGKNVATSVEQLGQFMLHPDWSGAQDHISKLFEAVDRPFAGKAEACAYRLYGYLINACGSWPCLLRPLDLILRRSGSRWYGYVYLSNQLWRTTI